MILYCKVCNKVKKFGKWIDTPEELGEVIKDAKVATSTLCPHCQSNVLDVNRKAQDR
ncbi:MAG: hypothetical protein ACE5HR_03015 [bacterium]